MIVVAGMVSGETTTSTVSPLGTGGTSLRRSVQAAKMSAEKAAIKSNFFIKKKLDPIQKEMLKSESQMYVRFGSAVSGTYRGM